MTAATKFWILAVANLLVVSLLGLVLYGMLLAFAVIAPEIPSWPLFTVVAIGLVLSLLALSSTRRVASRTWRMSGFAIHGSILAINLAFIGSAAALSLGSTTEKFLIPEGYKGDVYVIYNTPGGVPEQRTRREIIYVIPSDGVLSVREPMTYNFTKSEYFYQHPDGTLEKIRNYWPTTIPKTPENLSDDRDFGVYFPRTGNYSDGCFIQYQQFYVGTKAFLLTEYHEKHLWDYLSEHPGVCNQEVGTVEQREKPVAGSGPVPD